AFGRLEGARKGDRTVRKTASGPVKPRGERLRANARQWIRLSPVAHLAREVAEAERKAMLELAQVTGQPPRLLHRPPDFERQRRPVGAVGSQLQFPPVVG